MIAMHADRETVFTVLADSARQRGRTGLLAQLVVSLALAIAILVATPLWWSLAFLAGWSAAYSGWGLLDRGASRETGHVPVMRALQATIAALGTALAVAGIIGVGLAIYSGNARGVKDACGVNTHNKFCQAQRNPAPGTYPIR